MGNIARARHAAASTQYPEDWRRFAVPQDYAGVRRDWRKNAPLQLEKAKLFLHIVRTPEPLPVNEALFAKLTKRWREETVMHSALIKKVMHPAYQRIIGMGPAALPLILNEMKRKPGHWFWALDAITQGENPAADCISLTEATTAWIRWGEAKGLL